MQKMVYYPKLEIIHKSIIVALLIILCLSSTFPFKPVTACCCWTLGLLKNWDNLCFYFGGTKQNSKAHCHTNWLLEGIASVWFGNSSRKEMPRAAQWIQQKPKQDLQAKLYSIFKDSFWFPVYAIPWSHSCLWNSRILWPLMC